MLRPAWGWPYAASRFKRPGGGGGGGASTGLKLRHLKAGVGAVPGQAAPEGADAGAGAQQQVHRLEHQQPDAAVEDPLDARIADEEARAAGEGHDREVQRQQRQPQREPRRPERGHVALLGLGAVRREGGGGLQGPARPQQHQDGEVEQQPAAA